MTPDELRALADNATPGPWECCVSHQALEGWVCIRPEDTSLVRVLAVTDGMRWSNYEAAAALIAALGPDAARLLADAGDMWAQEHAECVGRFNPRLCNVCSWLARLDKLGTTDDR